MTSTSFATQEGARIDAAIESGSPRVWFETDATGTRGMTVWPGEPMLLADVCTMFESFGLRMAAHREVELPVGSAHTFEFGFVSHDETVLALIADACVAHATGSWHIDRYARLVATAGLPWREVVLLRAACRFLRQTKLGLSEDYIVDSLVRHPEFASAIVVLFKARLDPRGGYDDAAAERAVASLVESASTLDEDRIRRALQSFVLSVLRTNWFQLDTAGQHKSYVSFKIDSSQLSVRDAVVPFREIFVHSDDVEGVHLRSGAVARGGLRWSDRTEDFRTEVLGLMKTQSVKNAPIVPMGAKGAFVLRSASTSAAQGYRTFIKGMLDITDNIVGGVVVSPARTVRRDGDDPYLVVAADKGTAKFSDLANSIAAEYGFWLGDGFASGGSAGYDHKAMGITARGAWLSVRRHFAESGLDVDADEFTVVGIGDMSGDVFGNGMLLSRKIRLVGAFDHRHIFLDPTPDAEVSFGERQRLSMLPGSSWNDYAREKISAGGGVWPRTAKSIALSTEVRALLALDATECTPDELVQALLRARVDLLWNGGIGTYVRADAESDVDAQDPANDRVRVAARELRCRVIGEGGNLGLTQQARIDFALHGGRVNADFIDNAAGVATSDLEVNLKIALDAGVRSGAVTFGQRNALLADAADDVASRVLRDSANQILAISLASSQARHLLERHARLIGNLEAEGGIDPALEGLPSPAELKDRTSGLTRPEIAILLAQSKNLVCQELLDSTVPDEDMFADRLIAYFPRVVADTAAELIAAHPLRREIIATGVADELINRVGPGTIFRMQERLGVTTADVARAYAIVRGILHLDEVWADCLEGRMDETQRVQALLEVRELVEHLTSWLLRNRRDQTRPSTELDRFAGSVRQLMELARS
ncbi:NAD-glutamate dehydrogenase domain-containing protein [Antrihabitans sp. YC2-6]|uniref:NAD-glutamate dehydrogenase domain-containing protein n=1 Tax=Antrihabitans sp. YC2-6 TaxID=2799498 RepID=UPI0018F2A7F0|nr:NAD-glutamate dehydrogenase domain-containing protein [Antrihabitans sp. YC2-6]MBJ8346642.1 NAD-glutamate dehydrogenase [Antrihabitans sp. YC2-6]